jgi:hypothetical protein
MFGTSWSQHLLRARRSIFFGGLKESEVRKHVGLLLVPGSRREGPVSVFVDTPFTSLFEFVGFLPDFAAAPAASFFKART